MDLLNDYINLIGIKELVKNADSMEPHNLLVLYFQLQIKLIPQQQWNIVKSKEFNSSVSSELIPYIENIEKIAQSGGNLLPYCSCQVEHPEKTDGLLYDWGIKHLHLGHGTQKAVNPRYVNRANELLFLTYDANTLYFIKIANHKYFEELELLEIIHRNWIFLMNRYELKGVLSPTKEIKTKDEIKILRKNGVCALYTLENKRYIPPGGGITTNKSSNNAVLCASRIIRIIKMIKDETEKYCSDKNIPSQNCSLVEIEKDAMYVQVRDNEFIKFPI